MCVELRARNRQGEGDSARCMSVFFVLRWYISWFNYRSVSVMAGGKSTSTTKPSKREEASAKKLAASASQGKKDSEEESSENEEDSSTTSSESQSSVSSASVKSREDSAEKMRSRALKPRYVAAVGEANDKETGSALFDTIEAHIAMVWAEKRRKALKRGRTEKKEKEGSKKESSKKSKKGH